LGISQLTQNTTNEVINKHHRRSFCCPYPKFNQLYGRGAQVEQVDEPNSSRVLVCIEVEAYPEPKTLLPAELKALHVRFKSFTRAGDAIGTSEGFVRQNLNMRKGHNRER
jgi:hypothetical protein